MSSKNKGFSLIELMIVIAIIGVLAAVAIPSYQNYVLKSKLADVISYANAAGLAASEYLQSSGANDCSGMPGVADGNAFATPNSSTTEIVYINTDCGVISYGTPGIWGQEMYAASVQLTPTIDSEGISYTCSTGAVCGGPITFAPPSCPAE